MTHGQLPYETRKLLAWKEALAQNHSMAVVQGDEHVLEVENEEFPAVHLVVDILYPQENLRSRMFHVSHEHFHC